MTMGLALGLLGGFLLLVAILVSRIPVPCPHASQCVACERERELARLESARVLAQMDHHWHVEPVPDCRRCFPPMHDRRG